MFKECLMMFNDVQWCLMMLKECLMMFNDVERMSNDV